MKKNYASWVGVAVVAILAVYLLMLFFSGWSLTGFWTDFIFSGIYVILGLAVIFIYRTPHRGLNMGLRTAMVLMALVVLRFFWSFFADPFVADLFKMRSFYHRRVDGRVFQAYFRPVGAYSGGEGNLLITESPKLFPIIEREVYYEHAVRWDFNADSSEGRPVDNDAIVDEYIKDEITRKPKP